MLTEADHAGPPGVSLFDSQIGFALRRWCAPVLDLPPHAAADDYLARRAELGHVEVHRRLLRACGITTFCVDGGFEPEPLTSAATLAELAGGHGVNVVRLERVAEQVAVDVLTGQIGVAHVADAVRARLAGGPTSAARPTATRTVAVKSVAAYRAGLGLPAARPTDRQVAAAVRGWINEIRAGAPIRLTDPTLHAFLLWCGVEARLPIQIHVGYGDGDIDLRRGNPLLLTGLLRSIAPTETAVVLLHCYPFHREAGYLAQVFPNVHLDLGLAIHNSGRGSAALIAQALELAPFGKFLFSTDAFALGELYLLGARLFRRGLSAFLADGVADDAWTVTDAERVARLICADNARRVYDLP